MSAASVRPILYYVDHTCRFPHNSGIQRCVRSIARALIHAGQPLIPVIWNRHSQRLAEPGPAALEHLAAWNGPEVTSWSRWTTETPPPQWLLVTELVRGANNPSREALLKACRPLPLADAWLFHDAIPLRQSQLYGPAAQRIAAEHGAYMHQLGQARVVFCNSQQSHHELSDVLKQNGGKPASHLHTLVLAERFGAERSAPISHKPASAPLELLCVSTLEPRKNHAGLLKALAWLHSQGVRHWRLTLVGWPAEPAIQRLLDRSQRCGLPLRWFDRVTDAQLLALYERCDFTVFPSLEEGFGLPVAESLWHRRPCVCSGSGALGERAAGGGCETVDPRQWPSLAAGLKRLLTDPQRRGQLQHELEQRQFRSWSDVAQELLHRLKQLEPPRPSAGR